MHAVRDGDTVTVRTILSGAGALSLINTRDARGETPLYWVALNGNATVTERLIEVSCNLDLQEENGRTPLHAAVVTGHVAITQQLIEARCNVDLQTKNGTRRCSLPLQMGILPSRSI